MPNVIKGKKQKALLLALIAYRNEMMSALKIKPADHYYKLYTGKRAAGYRTKFWAVRKKFPTAKVKKYIKKNPFCFAGDTVYNVHFEHIPGIHVFYAPEAVALHFKPQMFQK